MDEKTIRAAMKMGRDAFKAGKSKSDSRPREYHDMVDACGDSDVSKKQLRAAWERGYDNASAAGRRGSGRTDGQGRYAGMLKRNGWA